MSYGRSRDTVAVTIANGASLSDEVAVGGRRIIGIAMPAAWTAADISFQAVVSSTSSAHGSTPTYGEVVDSGGTNVGITGPAAGEYVALADTLPLLGLGRIRVRSGTAAVPVNQGAARTLYLVLGD